ncbi:GNAT family N-acetyltransferase [Prevotella sp. 10(H)]|uniref:GNAT family N-acetyltransferase n=1 Tax=Prevotella sp. 10(H) TaxID=1158294 RepID=UPI00055BB3CF|nr:GNAT family N-acetyltransferase [Prevotella sp. 10(H)]
MTDITIEQANLQDLKEILQLQKEAFVTEAESHGNYDIEPLKQTYESILSEFQTHLFLKAMYENKIIGSVKYRAITDIVWVGKLIVNPLFRKRGIGRRLLTEVENLNPDAAKFQLFTAALSIHNIRLYESVGYEVHSTYKDENQSDLEMVEMIKLINR